MWELQPNVEQMVSSFYFQKRKLCHMYGFFKPLDENKVKTNSKWVLQIMYT